MYVWQVEDRGAASFKSVLTSTSKKVFLNGNRLSDSMAKAIDDWMNPTLTLQSINPNLSTTISDSSPPPDENYWYDM